MPAGFDFDRPDADPEDRYLPPVPADAGTGRAGGFISGYGRTLVHF